MTEECNMDLSDLDLNLSEMSTWQLRHSLMLLTHNGSIDFASMNNNTIEQYQHRQDPLEIVKWITPPLLLVLGTVGNFLAAAVLLQQRFRSISTSVFLLALAASDTVYLYFSNFSLIWLSQYVNLSPRLYSDWSCTIIAYVFRSAADFSSWLVVAVTIERLFAVCLPFHAKGLCSRPHALVIIGMILLIILIANTFTFFTYKVHTTYNNLPHSICYIDEALGPIITLAIVLYDDMCYSFLPACIICISNTTILVRMVKQARRTHKGCSENVFSMEAWRLTAMLVTVSCVFLVSTLPICTVSSYYAIMKYLELPLGGFNRPLCTLILRILMNSNHAFNFLLYCLSGPPFRHELCRMSHDTMGAVLKVGHPGGQTENRVIHMHEVMQHNGHIIPMIEKTEKTNEGALQCIEIRSGENNGCLRSERARESRV